MEIKQSALAANALCFLKVGVWGLTRAAAFDPKWQMRSTVKEYSVQKMQKELKEIGMNEVVDGC